VRLGSKPTLGRLLLPLVESMGNRIKEVAEGVGCSPDSEETKGKSPFHQHCQRLMCTGEPATASMDYVCGHQNRLTNSMSVVLHDSSVTPKSEAPGERSVPIVGSVANGFRSLPKSHRNWYPRRGIMMSMPKVPDISAVVKVGSTRGFPVEINAIRGRSDRPRPFDRIHIRYEVQM
jgi:hypothetical protein